MPSGRRAASSSRSARAMLQQSMMSAGAPGSRSNTTRSGSCGPPRGPTFHCGTCSSRAARLASQTRVGRSSATTYSTPSSPCSSIITVRTQSGVPRGMFFSKKGWLAVPSGHRLRVSRRSVRWGRIASATLDVVVDDLALGEPGVRIEHLVEIRQRQRASLDLDRHLLRHRLLLRSDPGRPHRASPDVGTGLRRPWSRSGNMEGLRTVVLVYAPTHDAVAGAPPTAPSEENYRVVAAAGRAG